MVLKRPYRLPEEDGADDERMIDERYTKGIRLVGTRMIVMKS